MISKGITKETINNSKKLKRQKFIKKNEKRLKSFRKLLYKIEKINSIQLNI